MASRGPVVRAVADRAGLPALGPNGTAFVGGDRCRRLLGPAPLGRSARSCPMSRCSSSGNGRTPEKDASGTGSSYGETAGVVKSLVGGLTDVVNWCGELMGSQGAGSEQSERGPPPEPIDPREVYRGVREDFVERGYPWSGEISENLYDEDCRFTDPTLSFRGLSKFKRNLENLKPIVERLLLDREVEMFSCELNEADRRVSASWRMFGRLDLPWKPCVDVSGKTVFTYDPDRGNRIVSYYETWDIPPAQALLQLVTPGQKKK